MYFPDSAREIVCLFVVGRSFILFDICDFCISYVTGTTAVIFKDKVGINYYQISNKPKKFQILCIILGLYFKFCE